MQYLFSKIQAASKIHFPFEESVKYSCLSGFIFNRFLNPAILSPNAFNINIGNVLDESGKRKLVLIAKALQNLSTLTEFGAKEAYMQSLNPLIQSYKPNMASFLNQISSIVQDYRIPSRTDNEFDLAKDCSELVETICFSLDKMKPFLIGNLLLPRLEVSIKLIHDKNKELPAPSTVSPFDSFDIKLSKTKSFGSSTGFLSRLATMSKNSNSSSIEFSPTSPSKPSRISSMLQSVPEMMKFGPPSSSQDHSHQLPNKLVSRQLSAKKSTTHSAHELFPENNHTSFGKGSQLSMIKSAAHSSSDISPQLSRAVSRSPSQKGNHHFEAEIGHIRKGQGRAASAEHLLFNAEKSDRTGNATLNVMLQNLARKSQIFTESPSMSRQTSVAVLVGLEKDANVHGSNLLNLTASETNLMSDALYFSAASDDLQG